MDYIECEITANLTPKQKEIYKFLASNKSTSKQALVVLGRFNKIDYDKIAMVVGVSEGEVRMLYKDGMRNFNKLKEKRI